MRLSLKSITLVLISSLTILPHNSFAWSNYFRIVNNFNFPLTYTIQSELADIDNPCEHSVNNIEISPKKFSCELEFETSKEHWYSLPKNRGTIRIAKKSDPNSYCVYHYDYEFNPIPYSYFNIHSENITLQECKGDLQSSEISVVNDKTKYWSKKLAGDFLVEVFKKKAPRVTESLSQADCSGEGGDNCMIISPDINKNYINNGSTLRQALALQAHLDQFDPLNFEQFIGSHNSAISQHYTTSHNRFNMSYADPDHYLSLTEQLDAGIRQLELDIEWYNNTVAICHNHVDLKLQGLLCEGNVQLLTAINEIKSWIEKNPHEMLWLYLDVNLPLNAHVGDLDNVLAQLEPYIFTPAMAQNYFKTGENTLPASKLTQDELINQYKKNIIITNDDDVDNLKNSKYVFVRTENSSAPLPEIGIDTFLMSSYANCNTKDKYQNIGALYPEDPGHFNLERLNEDRTVINFISCSDDHDPDTYENYFTTMNLPNILACPFNLLSTNMLGFTCSSTDCEQHPSDPRFAELLWSWELGFPLQTGSDIAYLNPRTGHFENAELTPGIYNVLCSSDTAKLTAPTAPLAWYLQAIDIKDTHNIAMLANQACASAGGIFASPTTSYWLSDVMQLVNNENKIIINYQRVNNEWIANGKSLIG